MYEYVFVCLSVCKYCSISSGEIYELRCCCLLKRDVSVIYLFLFICLFLLLIMLVFYSFSLLHTVFPKKNMFFFLLFFFVFVSCFRLLTPAHLCVVDNIGEFCKLRNRNLNMVFKIEYVSSAVLCCRRTKWILLGLLFVLTKQVFSLNFNLRACGRVILLFCEVVTKENEALNGLKDCFLKILSECLV